MPPTVMLVQGEVDLHKRPPLGPLRFADEVHACLVRRAVGFARVAGDAGADNIFPRRRTASVARDNVVEIQVFPLKNFAAILTGIVVALKNVVPRELHFLLRHPVIHEEQDDFGHANAERDGVNRILLRRAGGNILPLFKIERAERSVRIVHDHLGVTLEKKRERPAGGADIDRLPEPVQHKHMLV